MTLNALKLVVLPSLFIFGSVESDSAIFPIGQSFLPIGQ